MSGKTFIKTPHANLYRYGEKGKYHVQAHVNGRLVRQSLKTKSIEIALIQMGKVLDAARAKTVSKSDTADSLKVIWQKQRDRVEHSQLKPSSKHYKIECLDAIKRNDPRLFKEPLKALTPERLEKTASALRKKYSPTRYNGCMSALGDLFAAATSAGLVPRNPTDGLPRAPVPVVEPQLPEHKDWERVLKALDAVPHRKHGALFIRLISLMGARISAVSKLTVEDCDFERNEVLVPPVKYDEKPTRLPMFPALRTLLKAACEERGTGRIVTIGTPKKALAKACDDAGIARLTPQHLRHLFVTRCIESGVDIRTTAAWVGHKDGGALLLKRYAHLRREHSQKMAKKVRF